MHFLYITYNGLTITTSQSSIMLIDKSSRTCAFLGSSERIIFQDFSSKFLSLIANNHIWRQSLVRHCHYLLDITEGVFDKRFPVFAQPFASAMIRLATQVLVVAPTTFVMTQQRTPTICNPKLIAIFVPFEEILRANQIARRRNSVISLDKETVRPRL